MFESILVAIGGSPYSEYAVPDAIEIARRFKSTILALHVLERGVGRAGTFPMETTDEAEPLVAAAVRTFKEAGITASGELQHAATGRAASTSWRPPRRRTAI